MRSSNMDVQETRRCEHSSAEAEVISLDAGLRMEGLPTLHLWDQVLEVFDWVGQRARPSGVLPEQVHPHNGDPVSVSPLTWSHAVVVTTVLRWLLKHAELSGKPSGVVAGLARQDELR